MTERDVYVAVGSNVAPGRHIPAALAALAAAFAPLVCSTAYRSAAVGFEGADFVNCAVAGRTSLAPEAVLAELKALEDRMGRRRDGRIGPRELDLDLVLYGGEVIERPGLVIPRSDVLDYAFVLRPLAEIAPDFVHPLTGKSLGWHWRHFRGRPGELVPVDLAALGG